MTYDLFTGDPTTRRRFLKMAGAAGAGLFLADLAAACQQGSPAGGGDIKIGFLTAFTGLETILGETQFNCFQMAVDEINANGGIAGRKIQVVKEDDHTDTQVTIQKTDKLVKEGKVDVIIGLISSLERQAAMSVVPKLGALLMYTTYYEGGECKKNLISTGQVPNQQIVPFIPWLVKNVGKSLYMVGSDYVWPRGSADWVKSSLEKSGGAWLGAQFFPFGTTDFSPVLREIRNRKPDILWFQIVGADSINFAKQMADFGLKTQIAGTGTDEVFTYELPGVLTGALTNQAWFMNVDTPESKSFVDRYQKRFGANKPINAIAEAAYDSVYLYKAAVEKAGTTDVAQVLKAFSKVEYNAPQGRVRIDPGTNVMVSNSLLGKVGKSGPIEIIEKFGFVDPVVPGCQLA